MSERVLWSRILWPTQGILFACIVFIYVIFYTEGDNTSINLDSLEAIPIAPSYMAFTIYSNDSIANLTLSDTTNYPNISFQLFSNDSIDKLNQKSPRKYSPNVLPIDTINFLSILDQMNACPVVLTDSTIYKEGWDSLHQTIFWQNIISMDGDQCLVNIAKTRQVLDTISSTYWAELSDSSRSVYQDSLRSVMDLDSTETIYATTGKNHYYNFESAIPSIARGVALFKLLHLDPWYAQAILLIESPGELRFSPVGAYGSFQLMKEVAMEYGLIVNDSIDERKEFDKSAYAAAQLIKKRCIPQARAMLKKHELPFKESDLWFRLLVLHIYHAGAGNVMSVLNVIQPTEGGIPLLQQIWSTESKGFKNASQNYTQIALASLLTLDNLVHELDEELCVETEPVIPDTSAYFAAY